MIQRWNAILHFLQHARKPFGVYSARRNLILSFFQIQPKDSFWNPNEMTSAWERRCYLSVIWLEGEIRPFKGERTFQRLRDVRVKYVESWRHAWSAWKQSILTNEWFWGISTKVRFCLKLGVLRFKSCFQRNNGFPIKVLIVVNPL